MVKKEQAILGDSVPHPKQTKQVAANRLPQNRGHGLPSSFAIHHSRTESGLSSRFLAGAQGLRRANHPHPWGRGPPGAAADGLPIPV